jgi:hypothetical protein
MAESLSAFLDALADEGRVLRTVDLTEASDLTRDELMMFRAAWDGLSSGRRLELITAMVEQAEANIHLNFHAVLRACLEDRNPRIRKLAIEGLWEDERITLMQPLLNLLGADPDPGVAAAAATSLGRYLLQAELGELAEAPAQKIQSALRAVWEQFDAPVEVRRRALESLAYCNNAAVHEMIHSAYYDDDELLRQSALFAMGRSADSRWARFVLAEIDSQQPAMRFESAVAAGEIGLRQAVRPLVERLEDPDSSVREAAAIALGKIGGPVARRALMALLHGPDEALAQAAEEALDELAFSSQHLDTPAEQDDLRDAAPRRQRDGTDEDGDEDEDEFGALYGDEDDDLADLYPDEAFDDDDEFAAYDDDDDDDDDEDWDDEEDEDAEDCG